MNAECNIFHKDVYSQNKILEANCGFLDECFKTARELADYPKLIAQLQSIEQIFESGVYSLSSEKEKKCLRKEQEKIVNQFVPLDQKWRQFQNVYLSQKCVIPEILTEQKMGESAFNSEQSETGCGYRLLQALEENKRLVLALTTKVQKLQQLVPIAQRAIQGQQEIERVNRLFSKEGKVSPADSERLREAEKNLKQFVQFASSIGG